MKARLFVGNLSSTVTDGELRAKFEALLAGHKAKGEADVGKVEIRCKNENNYFGYVDIHLQDPLYNDRNSNEDSFGEESRNAIPMFLRKYIDLMNNTKWKGSLMKVQLAKESFIDKLKKEQQGNRREELGNPAAYNKHSTIYADSVNSKNSRQKHNGEKYNDGTLSEHIRIQKQADDVLRNLDMKKERRSIRFSDKKESSPTDVNYGFQIIRKDTVFPNNFENPPKTLSNPSKRKQQNKSDYSSGSENDSDNNTRDGIPKFKGLLQCYPCELSEELLPLYENGINAKLLEENVHPENKTSIGGKLLTLVNNTNAVDKHKVNNTEAPILSSKSIINFKKNKQQLSDLLRLQSLEKIKQLKAQRNNLIKSSLSSVPVSVPISEQRKRLTEDNYNDEDESPYKTSKMTLFYDDSEQEDNDNNNEVFNLKKQFEGEGGQELLELKMRWGNDDRFKIDDRFKNSDTEENVEPVEQEKEKQLDILTDILGKKCTSTKDFYMKEKRRPVSASVILSRYDPEAVEETDNQETIRKKENVQSLEPEDMTFKFPTETNNPVRASESEEKTIRITEPATFKTVSNLKALFSTFGDGDNEDLAKVDAKAEILVFTSKQQSNFSLLATFGNDVNDDKANNFLQRQHTTTPSFSKGVETPRHFWKSNPFRYDSSDDEGGSKGSQCGYTRKTMVTASTVHAHRKEHFFFVENDDRFDGLEKYFLHDENANKAILNDGVITNVLKEFTEDFALKRQELKSIVKAKIRNTRRKDEKRTLAIKRAIRKRKTKIHQRCKQF